MVKLPFGFEKPEDSPGFLLWQTTMIWQRQIKKSLETYDISHAQFVIMATLLWFQEHHSDTTQTLIANWSKLDKMTVSKSLKELAAKSLVSRQEHATDTRAKSITLTDKGKTLIGQLVSIVENIDAQFFGKISNAEQGSLIKMLNKLTQNTPNILFKPFKKEHIPLWQAWSELPHVKEVWFIEGYETTDYIHQKIAGNGYDYPFVIFLDEKPIGYIVCCDLYSYRTICQNTKGVFTNEAPGTFGMDLFIADEAYLNKGYGTKIVQAFVQFIFHHFKAKVILIDPATSNKRAIHCYEKAGFSFLREAFDGITTCYVMQQTAK